VIDSIQRHAQRFLAFAGHGIVKADALDEAAIAPITRIGDHYVEKGALFRTTSGQSYDHHVESCELKKGIDYMMETTAAASRRIGRRSISEGRGMRL